MIDTSVLNSAKQLKKEMDAAYKVFKKTPTLDNASIWTNTVRTFNDFCVKVIEGLIEDNTSDNTEEILSNIDKYKTCKLCGAEILFSTSDDSFIASSDFVEDFPGWCYNCLVEYCANHNCETCSISENPAACSFKEIKELTTSKV